MQPEDRAGVGVLHESCGDSGEDRADEIPAHRVVDDQNHVRIEERERVRIEAVEQRVERERDEQPDCEAQPPHGVYLTTSFGTLRVCSTMTSSMLPKSTDGFTEMVLNRSCPFSAFTPTPTGIPFG